MAEYSYANAVVDGKTVRDWMKSDEGLVDYAKCAFRKNVSVSDEFIIYDLGEYEYDSSVGETTWCNGVDLARVAACVKYGEPYGGMHLVTAINGDDYVRIFFHNYIGATIPEFILFFFRLVDGDIYISETNYHVFVKGRSGTDEEWETAANALKAKWRH